MKLKPDTIGTNKAKLWADEKGIFHVLWNLGVEITIEDARDTTKALLKISQGRRNPLWVDIRGIKNISQEVRIYDAIDEVTTMVS
ncbi:MAG: hypothetical protein H6636_13790 [Anaerolineales bacterium]|nr:hypothetical protein [Anaerolineales bacterium]